MISRTNQNGNSANSNQRSSSRTFKTGNTGGASAYSYQKTMEYETS